MKNAKKAAALLLVLLLTFSLAACGSPGETATETPLTATEASATPAPTEQAPNEPESVLPLVPELSTLTAWQPWSGNLTSVGLSGFHDSVAHQALEELTNVHIEYLYANAMEAGNQFQLFLATGDLTDMCADFSFLYTAGVDAAIDEGLIADLSDYYETGMPHYKALMESQDGLLKRMTTDQGRMGLLYSIIKDVTTVDFGPIIRQDWLDELGMAVPVTYDQWHDTLAAFKAEYGCESPLNVQYSGFQFKNALVGGYGVAGFAHPGGMYDQFINVDGTVKYSVLEQGYKDYLTMMSGWYNEGLFYGDFISETNMNTAPDDMVNTGQMGIVYTGALFIEAYNQSNVDPDCSWIGIGDAVLEPGGKSHVFEQPQDLIGGHAIFADSENVELAVRWYDALFTDEITLLAQYGVKDLSYELDESGKPQFTDLVLNNSDGWNIEQARLLYTLRGANLGWRDGNMDRLGYSETELAALEAWAAATDSEWFYPSSASMTGDEYSTYSSTYADIKTLVDENALQFMLGQRDMAEWDDFIRQIYDMGIETCIAIKQAALDRYLARG